MQAAAFSQWRLGMEVYPVEICASSWLSWWDIPFDFRKKINEGMVMKEVWMVNFTFFLQVSWWSIASVAMDNGPFLDGLPLNMVIFP